MAGVCLLSAYKGFLTADPYSCFFFMTSVGTFNPPSPGRAPALFGVALGEWLMMIDNQVV